MTDLPPLATGGRRFGLGRKTFTPREHCKRCHEIAQTADQVVMNYILANGRQVDIINRLMKDPDGAREVVRLGQLLAEKDSVIAAVYQADSVEQVRNTIDSFKEEVSIGGEDRGGEEGASKGDAAQAKG